jgi:Flp pilus assembly protein TadG
MGYRSRIRLGRGQAMLEILLVLLILIPLIFGGIELSRAVSIRSALDSGVAVAARTLSLDPSQWAWASGVVNDSVDQNVFGSAGVEKPITLFAADSCSSDTAIDITALSFGDSFCLIGQTHFTPDIPFLTTTKIRIRVCHCGLIEKLGD